MTNATLIIGRIFASEMVGGGGGVFSGGLFFWRGDLLWEFYGTLMPWGFCCVQHSSVLKLSLSISLLRRGSLSGAVEKWRAQNVTDSKY